MSKPDVSTPRFISYRRVSTDEQGKSGLGLEAQESAILAYVKAQGGVLVADYVEVGSGGDDDRPELMKARAAAVKHKATLAVAKLDRLSRDLAFIATFLKGEKKAGKPVPPMFVSVDNPTATRQMHQLAGMFAEFERERISERTRAALAALKARGVQLGSPDLESARKAAVAARKARAAESNARYREIIEGVRARGVSTLKGIAAELNRLHIAAPRGGEWSATQVSRVML